MHLESILLINEKWVLDKQDFTYIHVCSDNIRAIPVHPKRTHEKLFSKLFLGANKLAAVLFPHKNVEIL